MSKQVLRIRGVVRKTGASRTTVYDWMRRGQFPRPIRLGARAVGWLESEIDSWIEGRVAATNASRED